MGARPNRLTTWKRHRPGERTTTSVKWPVLTRSWRRPGPGRRRPLAVTVGLDRGQLGRGPAEDQVELVDADAAGVEVGLHRATRGQADGGDGGKGREQGLTAGRGHHLADHGQAGEQHDGQHHRHGQAPAGVHGPRAYPPAASPDRPSRAEPEAVEDHDQAGQSHGHGGHQRVEEPEGGQREGRDVVAHGPPEVLHDDRVGRSGHPDGGGNPLEVVAEQGDVAVGQGGLRTAPDGAPDIGGGQRRGVVDPVAHHHHPPRRAAHGRPGPRPCRPGSGRCGRRRCRARRPRCAPPARCRR